MGQTPSYADFILVTMFKWFQRIDNAFYERAVGHDEALRKQYESCEQWMQKDD